MTHTVLEDTPTKLTLDSTNRVAAEPYPDACGFGSGRCPYCDGPETD